MRTETEIRAELDLAWLALRDKTQDGSNAARQHLSNLRLDIEEQYAGTALSAEYQHAWACFAARGDTGAEAEFDEAIELYAILPDPDPRLQMRVHAHYADFLERKGKRSKARPHYAKAKELAAKLGLTDKATGYQLKMTELDMQSNDPMLKTLQSLLEMASAQGFTSCEISAALGEISTAAKQSSRGRIAARREFTPSDEYIRSVLDSIKRKAE